MENHLIERMKNEGWAEQNGSIYYWQHRDGRKLERADNGNWYLLPIRGKRQVIGNTMKQAFMWASGYAVVR